MMFGPGSKICDNLYTRQDGTRSYFFTCEELAGLSGGSGLAVLSNERIERRTVNKKEGVDATRFFIQTKLVKPEESLGSGSTIRTEESLGSGSTIEPEGNGVRGASS